MHEKPFVMSAEPSAMSKSSPWQHSRSASIADDIDFEIKSEDLQLLEIELIPEKARLPKRVRWSGRRQASA